MKSVYIGNKEFKLDNNQVYVMGILNVTPDSFSDGNKYNSIDKALIRVNQMIQDGATIIDVGGESTRPGYTQISEDEEIERVAAIIEKIKKEFDITVSIDTYKTKVAKEAFIAGADMLNDIWGLLYEESVLSSTKDTMVKLVKEYNTSVCLMHNDIENMRENDINIVIDRLKKSIDKALEYGVDKRKILIDPGIGFAKSYENNLFVMKNLDKLNVLNMPLLLGISNKSMVGIATNEDIDNRIEGNIAGAIHGIYKGAKFIRVHNVKEHVRAIKMIQAIYSE